MALSILPHRPRLERTRFHPDDGCKLRASGGWPVQRTACEQHFLERRIDGKGQDCGGAGRPWSGAVRRGVEDGFDVVGIDAEPQRQPGCAIGGELGGVEDGRIFAVCGVGVTEGDSAGMDGSRWLLHGP